MFCDAENSLLTCFDRVDELTCGPKLNDWFGQINRGAEHSGKPMGEFRPERQVAESAGTIDPGITNVHSRTFDSKETWTVYPLNEQLFVVARNGVHLSTSQLEAIRKICNTPPKKSSKNTRTR
jgi:hypothetical protein